MFQRDRLGICDGRQAAQMGVNGGNLVVGHDGKHFGWHCPTDAGAIGAQTVTHSARKILARPLADPAAQIGRDDAIEVFAGQCLAVATVAAINAYQARAQRRVTGPARHR